MFDLMENVKQLQDANLSRDITVVREIVSFVTGNSYTFKGLINFTLDNNQVDWFRVLQTPGLFSLIKEYTAGDE